jgi:hypothetical protein
MISRKPSKVCIAIDTEFSLVKTPISAISDDGADWGLQPLAPYPLKIAPRSNYPAIADSGAIFAR